jgi:hypothetical protein
MVNRSEIPVSFTKTTKQANRISTGAFTPYSIVINFKPTFKPGKTGRILAVNYTTLPARGELYKERRKKSAAVRIFSISLD